MKKLILLTLFIFLLSVGVFAQIEKKVIRWQSGSSFSDSIMSDGQELKIIHTEDVSIAVTLIEKKNWIPHSYITIENITSRRLLIDPTNWTLSIISPKQTVLASKEPEKLARSLEKRGKWAAALGAVGASMATQQSTATVSNSDGTTSTATITTPDEGAKERAAANSREQRASLGSVADYVRAKSLKPNTLFAKESISGIVWFEDKKYKEVVLTIVIDGTTFEFPFQKKN